MTSVGQRAIRTQRRVIAFFQDALGYACLGHWKDREGLSNVEQALLVDGLKRQRHSDKITAKMLLELGRAAALSGSNS